MHTLELEVVREKIEYRIMIQMDSKVAHRHLKETGTI